MTVKPTASPSRLCRNTIQDKHYRELHLLSESSLGTKKCSSAQRMSQFSLGHGYDFHGVLAHYSKSESAFSTWVGSEGGGSAKGQAFSKWTWLKTSRPSENAIVTSHASSSLPISTAPKLFCHDFEPEHPNVEESRRKMHRSAPSFGSKDDTLPITALPMIASWLGCKQVTVSIASTTT